MADDDEALKKLRDREALEEWLRTNRAETARRDLTDAAPQTDKGTATYTQLEAIDRAGHIPGWHEQAVDGRETRPPVFTAEEEKLLAEQKRDMAELYPSEAEAVRWQPRLAPPTDPQARAQYDDMLKQYPQMGEALGEKEKERPANMTPEQQAKVDRAMADVNTSKDIGAASNVSGKPVPNDPTPMEKARDIGQDLRNAGVTMQKE